MVKKLQTNKTLRNLEIKAYSDSGSISALSSSLSSPPFLPSTIPACMCYVCVSAHIYVHSCDSQDNLEYHPPCFTSGLLSVSVYNTAGPPGLSCLHLLPLWAPGDKQMPTPVSGFS